MSKDRTMNLLFGLLTFRFKDAKFLKESLKTLSPQEERVIRLRFGIGDPPDHALDTVGGSFALTREKIRRVEKSALKKLWVDILTPRPTGVRAAGHEQRNGDAGSV